MQSVSDMSTILRYVFGPIYIILSSFLLFLNVAYVLLIRKSPKTNISSTYRIIANICFAGSMQLIPFIAGGVMTLANSVFHFYLDRILGILLESGWILYVCLLLSLAVDRLLYFIKITTRIRALLVTSLILASWLVWLASAIVVSLPDFGYTYENPGRIGWTFYDIQGAVIMATLENYVNLVFSGITLTLYLALFLYIVKMRSSVDNVSKSEYRLLKVAFVTFTYETLFGIWNVCDIQFPSNSIHRIIVFNLIWIVHAGFFALMSVIVNKNFRKMLKKVYFKSKKSVSHVDIRVASVVRLNL
ncbi:hypothetical protein L596_021803 [Steinernema carpocapsae]|uniref:G-protein coupled receptors family 1 profile domain-containing protein n=1 Tax=Steinernema carpocapsae TaxID=34508 RepID=A0A4U5MKM9_STECR|nr:hypothetical protein L596_021803 [Steinernema carpocapsae]